MCNSLWKPLLIGGAVRYFLFISSYFVTIQNRVEISTPINSWKRVREGVFLYNMGINPYDGDMYHENPLILVGTNFLISHLEKFIPFVFILLDILTSCLLKEAIKVFINGQYENQKTKEIAKNIDELLLNKKDLNKIPYYVMLAYLMNPFSILNCIGQTTTVWSNFVLALFFYFMSQENRILAVFAIALETQKNLYPFVLIVPAALFLSRYKANKAFDITCTMIFFVVSLLGLNYISFLIINDWNFLNATYGFILNHRDFQPNIGLFWYFFMEMFDHFRTLFLCTFQLNATVLYLFPLTFKLKDEPIMLATVLCALSAVFRSYPCIGDVGFYLSLLPLWKKSSKLSNIVSEEQSVSGERSSMENILNVMTQNFIVGCFLVVTSVLGPTVHYLWIYTRSANANFYFGVTLAFSTAQIFLVTDLLFAYIKREFCLKHGLEFKVDGKEASMALE